MSIKLSDEQECVIWRELAYLRGSIGNLMPLQCGFEDFGWDKPAKQLGQIMDNAFENLSTIAKTMQDASEIEPVAVVNAQIGDAA